MTNFESFSQPKGPQSTKFFERLPDEGIVQIQTQFPPSKSDPNATTKVENFRVVFQRERGSASSLKIGNSNDISWDYLDDDTKNLLIMSIKHGSEHGSINIPGQEGREGTQLAWMLKIIRDE